MSLAARIKRLERTKGVCGPGCPPRVVLHVGDDWYGPPDTQQQAEYCPRCGRPAEVLRVVYDPNFYGNAHLLQET